MQVTDQLPVPQDAPPPPPRPVERWITRADVVFGGSVVVGLAVVGVPVGLIWQLISPGRPAGFRYAGGPVFAFEESEAMIAADGRFVLLTAIVGLLAGGGAWLVVSRRGAITAAALALGGLAGAVVADLVGWATGGGSASAPAETLIKHLPLRVHAAPFLLIEALLALLVYLLGALFTRRDDLGRTGAARLPDAPPAPDAPFWQQAY